MTTRTCFGLLCGFALLTIGSTTTSAGQVGLAWNGSAGASGYRVHYGPGLGNYTVSADVGSVTQVVANVPDCAEWHFAVTAYNVAGESGYSNDVSSVPRVRLTGMSPTSARQGQQVTVSIDGANFDPRKEWEVIVSPDPCVPGTNGNDCWLYNLAPPTVTCNRIQVMTTVEPLAQDVRPAKVGNYTMTFRTTDGSQSVSPQTFTVAMDHGRVNVNRSSGATTQRLDGADQAWFQRMHGQCDPQIHGSTCNPSQFDHDYDFNGDGYVDGNDLVYLVDTNGFRFGTCFNGVVWTIDACPADLR